MRHKPSRFLDEKDTASDLLRAIIGHELETRPEEHRRRLLRVLVRDLRARVAKPA